MSVSKPRHGISLAEVVISTMLVGVILVSALASVGAATRSWLMSADRADGGALARELIAEITSLAYEDPNQSPQFGLESGELPSPINRLGFDDLDDYKDFTDNPPRARAGMALPNYAGWQRVADITKLNASTHTALPDAVVDNGLRIITVTVTSPQGKATTLSAYRSQAGGSLQPQGTNQTVVTWVGCELTAGTATPVSSAVSLLNHASDQ